MEGTNRVTSTDRTEEQVVQELTAEERALLKRVLEIERAKLHVRAYEATDDLLAAVKEILP
jgi:conjugal transfer/entry exclusion protein